MVVSIHSYLLFFIKKKLFSGKANFVLRMKEKAFVLYVQKYKVSYS